MLYYVQCRSYTNQDDQDYRKNVKNVTKLENVRISLTYKLDGIYNVYINDQ